jgi:D-inositol-3-phosphate glycosyltransferase
MGRAASVHAQGFGWQRTAAITQESYHTAVSQYFGSMKIPVGHTP